jgi:aromatic-L-amino-acid decarboxylase
LKKAPNLFQTLILRTVDVSCEGRRRMSIESKEETLDPEDWDKMRELGHRMLDDMMNRLQTIRDHKFSWASEQEIKNILVPLTSEGEGEEKVYEIFRDNIMNDSLIHIKPIFWGVVAGTGSPYGMLAC